MAVSTDPKKIEELLTRGVEKIFPNTEPKLRLNLEAVDRATMEARRDEIIAFIKQNA